MGMLAMLSRPASPLHRCVVLGVLVFIFLASFTYLSLLPGQNGFTTTRTEGNYRLQHQTELHSSGESDKLNEVEHKDASSCDSELAHLRGLGLTRNITYSRRCIKPIFLDDADRAVVTNISSTLLTNTTIIDLDSLCSTHIKDMLCHPLQLPVPPPDLKSHDQYAHLLFGIATNSKRLRDSKVTFAHWLADSGATLVCIITDGPKELLTLDFEALEADYAVSGMILKLVGRHDIHHSPEQSHMMVIRNLLSYATASSIKPRWLGILDDDTFIPSIHALSTELARHDHTHSRYLGALTEDANALRQGVLAAWGGAGIFLSLALAAEIEPHLNKCLIGSPGGDMLIMKCIHAHSRARLTTVEGLWQMDFFGNTAGFYESGRRALSMHHWKSWHWLPVREMAAITHICGDCFLARYVFTPDADGVGSEPGVGGGTLQGQGIADGVTVLNVGYSINVYTGQDSLPDLSRTEQTWDGSNAWEDYEWSVGPLRPKVDTEKKKTWWLKTAVHGQNGDLTQVYLHDGEGEGMNDEIIELVWQP